MVHSASESVSESANLLSVSMSSSLSLGHWECEVVIQSEIQ